MNMTSDLFHFYKTAANYGDSATSSVARAQLKAWDQRHESQPSWEEDHRDYEGSEQVWQAVTCGNPEVLDTMEYEVDHLMLLPEEKWIFIKNPVLTTQEVWQLCADESADEREDRYGHRHDDIEECWDDYDDYYYYDDYDYDDDYDYYDDWEESDHPSDVFYCYEEEVEAEKRCEDASVWQTTRDEIAWFDESCDPLQPEPRPLISDHHNRKAA